MSDAKLTADIIIRFNEEMLKKFNKILKKTEKSLKVIAKVTDKVTISEKNLNQETKKHTENLKKDNKESKKRETQATRTAASMGKLTATVAKVRVAIGLLKFVAAGVVGALAIPAGIVGGWVAFLDKMSRGEREINKMARSVQVGTGFLKAFSMATKDAGLSADNAIDMLEEMSNKVGDGLETPTHGTTKAFDELGLSLKEVQKMSRQKGLTTIMDSLVKFNRRTGSDQKTVRLADEIFGGEGNKFAGYLLESGELFSDLINKNKEFNMISADSSETMDDFGNALEKTKTMASGLVSEGLAPTFERLVPVFEYIQKLFVDNKDAITSNISGMAKSMTDIAMKITKIFGERKNFLQIMLDTAIGSLENMVDAVDNILKSMERVYNVYDEMQRGDTTALDETTKDIAYGIASGVEGVAGAVGVKLAKSPVHDYSPENMNKSYDFYGGGEVSKKPQIIVEQHFNMSGDNQQEVVRQASEQFIDTVENN